jgi:hypothetical protein
MARDSHRAETRLAAGPSRAAVDSPGRAGYQNPWPFLRAVRVSGQQPRSQAAEPVQRIENPHLIADRRIARRKLAKNELPLRVGGLDQASTGVRPPGQDKCSSHRRVRPSERRDSVDSRS